MNESNPPFWSREVEKLLAELQSSPQGLSSQLAARRALQDSPRARPRHDRGAIWLLLGQFKSPITIILIFAAVLSYFLHDRVDATIIMTIILVSALLGFWQEYGAANALKKLLSLVTTKTAVLRDGQEVSIPTDEIVPGDVVTLVAGGSIPADCRVIESRDLFVDEATLTGETDPAEKQPGVLPVDTPLAKRSNALFLGTHVVSGTAMALVVAVGVQTQFGKISERLRLRPPETAFERGIRRFGFFLMEVTLLLVVAIFAINVYFHKPVIEAFLFSLALAVGLTPQLLPAIISVNLAQGAKRMAACDVIVRRLAAIENFGSMNVLCSDKTGTLTQGVIRVQQAVDGRGQLSDRVMLYASLNAGFESGFANPIDEAIREQGHCDLSTFQKLDESPYDFVRKRLSVLVADHDQTLLVTKGAVDNVLAVCDAAEMADGSVVPLTTCAEEIQAHYLDFGGQGLRTLGVAYRRMDGCVHAGKEAEQAMVFAGFLVLQDLPKAHIGETIRALHELGVSLKMITGDNRRVAASVASQVGLSSDRLLAGDDLRTMSDEALIRRVNTTDVFAEVEPNQKERIILACQKAGNVVGYMGDGINDATGLHAADVGISVDQAVDVAKEAADIVLLKQDLAVLVEGVREGRRTFANTMKYVFMATSANFGNMFSMAGASLFLNFLPLLPKQILLMNLLTDLPEMTIARDSVDEELVSRPQRWDIHFIRNFMLVFGTLSSAFDFLTFLVLMFVFKANVAHFRTAWFLESVVSATLVVLIVRTRRLVLRSMPSKLLVLATLVAIGVTVSLPWLPAARLLGLTPVPAALLAALAVIVLGYVVSAELAKAVFYRQMATDAPYGKKHLAYGTLVILLLLAAAGWMTMAHFMRIGPFFGRYQVKSEDLRGLPLEQVPIDSSPSTAKLVAILITGDGGWTAIDQRVAAVLADHDVATVGWLAPRYFWQERSAAEAGRDLARVMDHFTTHGQAEQIILIGYSRGACVLPFMVNRLPRDKQTRIAEIALLGPSKKISFVMRPAEYVWRDAYEGDLDVLPEVARLPQEKLLCVYGKDEPDSICKRVDSHLATRGAPGRDQPETD